MMVRIIVESFDACVLTLRRTTVPTDCPVMALTLDGEG